MRLRLALSVVPSVNGDLWCPETKCLQNSRGRNRKKKQPRGRARHTFPFCACTPRGVTGALCAPEGAKLSPCSQQLSQNYTHAGLNIWEQICRGSYLNVEVRPQFPDRTHIVCVLPLAATWAKLHNPNSAAWGLPASLLAAACTKVTHSPVLQPHLLLLN